MPRQNNSKDPFQSFDSSPEVIGLVVMTYVQYPLGLRNVEDMLFERGHRHMQRDHAALVEPVRADVCWRDQAEAGCHVAPPHPVALAPRRGLREDERVHALPLASGRPRGRGA